jgi:hypothetical protein
MSNSMAQTAQQTGRDFPSHQAWRVPASAGPPAGPTKDGALAMSNLDELDRRQAERLRELLTEIRSAPAGDYAHLLGRVEVAAADVLAIIDRLTGRDS